MSDIEKELEEFHLLLRILGGSVGGNALTATVSGVLTVQSYLYYQRFPNDRWTTKFSVAFLNVLQAFQIGCFTQSLYAYLITDLTNPILLATGTWEFTSYQVVTVLSSVTVQTFFARRIYELSNNWWLTASVQSLVLLQFGLGVATSTEANIIKDSATFVLEETWLVTTWLACEAVVDSAIAASMCFLLVRRRTGFASTDSIINRLVLYTIQTGLFTSVLAIIVLAVFASFGFHLVVLLLGVPLGAFYSVSMLANLHSRSSLRALDRRSQRQTDNIPLSSISYPGQAKRRHEREHVAHDVSVTSETFLSTDYSDTARDMNSCTSRYASTSADTRALDTP